MLVRSIYLIKLVQSTYLTKFETTLNFLTIAGTYTNISYM